MGVRPPRPMLTSLKIKPALLGRPISIGNIDGMPQGPLRSAVPNGRSHKVLPVAGSMALSMPKGGCLRMTPRSETQPVLTSWP